MAWKGLLSKRLQLLKRLQLQKKLLSQEPD
jgi:hypothetical protein